MDTRNIRILGRLFQPVLLLPLLLPRPALHAQEGGPPRGDVEIGIRTLAGDRNSSQFNEYRDLTPGLYIQRADVDLEHLLQTNYFLTFQTRQSWQKDQRFLATMGKYGKFGCDVRWDGTPHDFTNAAAILYTSSGPGIFTMPAAIRTNLVSNSGSLPQMLMGAAPLDVALQRKLGSGTCRVTPSANWSFFAQYSHDSENGYRPLGTTLNNTTNVLELPEPVDYRTHEVKTGVEYGTRKGGFQAGYADSIFNNQVGTMVWDNPFNATNAGGAAAQGRLSLYPDNTAQSFNFAGAINLSASTRLMVSISPGWMSQNASFLPYTINPAVANVPQLPGTSLNGRKKTLAANITLTSHPLAQLTLTAHYRDYDYMNDTPSLLFPNYVATDSSLGNLARQSLPYGFNRQSAGTTASWLLHKGEAVTLGYEFVSMDREHRDVAKSLEHTGSVTVDVNPKKWFSLRTSYQRAERAPESYVTNLEIYPNGGNPAVIPAFQMFDEAARSRSKGSALMQVDAGDRLSFSASYDNTQDRYHDSVYGLLGYRALNSSVDATYQLHNNVSLFASYAYERYKSDQRSRQYSAANNTSNNDWESYIADNINTVSTGFSVSRLRNKMTLDAFYSLSFAKGQLDNRILGNPSLTGFLVTTAQDYPETGNRFHQLTGAVRYQLSNNVFSRIEYQWERYDRADFQIQNMTPYMGLLDSATKTSIFLGADVPGYQVHIVSVSLEYRF
ncbi:MAG: MtrB/PioB family decaheme-associated outer membrane protein [Acidobacteriia bacterium]|nr:MtrB/PioB family decaheme-associated outer membrane protein [Terriglobia bacterium]